MSILPNLAEQTRAKYSMAVRLSSQEPRLRQAEVKCGPLLGAPKPSMQLDVMHPGTTSFQKEAKLTSCESVSTLNILFSMVLREILA